LIAAGGAGCRAGGDDTTLVEARRVAEKAFETSASARGAAVAAKRDGACVAVAIRSRPADGSPGVPHLVVLRRPPSGDGPLVDGWEQVGVRDIDGDAEAAVAQVDGRDGACGFR
jgi:hypothetical protein